jgi:hypothetical protein
MSVFRLRALFVPALLAAAPAAAQTVFLDAVQAAANVTANVAESTSQAAAQTQQTVSQTQQAVQAAQSNPLAAAQAAATPSSSAMTNVQPLGTPVVATNCSPAPTPEMFRACLQASQHHDGSWRAQHPTVAQPKSGSNGPGFGIPPSRIMPTPRTPTAQ